MALIDNYKGFDQELCTLFLMDQKSQSTLGMYPSSSKQLFIINEAIFSQAFRCLENFIEAAFIEYSISKPTLSGKAVTSFLNPKNSEHAYELIKSSHPFLEWNSADTLIKRSEIYLDNGDPVKLVITAHKEVFGDIKKIRNHIAHNSRESLDAYKKVINKHYTTLPLSIPIPGEYLQQSSKKTSAPHLLREYLTKISDIGRDLAG
jgi:hypothetical protein